MANKESSRETEYQYRENNEPHKQTSNINSRNNNVSVDSLSSNEPNVENANDTGIGDSGINDGKLTQHTQNHSADA